MMKNIEHRVAGRFGKWIMKKLKFDGFTSFWSVIYYSSPLALNNEELRNHELVHVDQINNDGKIKFFFKYSWYLFKYGYYDNLYEIEARDLAKKSIDKNKIK